VQYAEDGPTFCTASQTPLFQNAITVAVWEIARNKCAVMYYVGGVSGISSRETKLILSLPSSLYFLKSFFFFLFPPSFSFIPSRAVLYF